MKLLNDIDESASITLYSSELNFIKSSKIHDNPINFKIFGSTLTFSNTKFENLEVPNIFIEAVSSKITINDSKFFNLTSEFKKELIFSDLDSKIFIVNSNFSESN